MSFLFIHDCFRRITFINLGTVHVLDVHRLRLLRELSQRGTLAAVADALGYTPSTVSHQLSVLEKEAGVQLLQPQGRGVQLTSAAHALVAHAEIIIEQLEQADAELHNFTRGLSGRVKIASFQTASWFLVPDTLRLLSERHPQLELELTTHEYEQALPRLVARDCDFVIGESYPGNPLKKIRGVEYEALFDDPLVLAWPKHLGLEPGKNTLQDLASFPWVMEPEGSFARQWSVAACRRAGFEPDVRFDSGDVFLHVRIVEEGLAAALLPGLVWHGSSPTIPTQQLSGLDATRNVFTAVRSGGGQNPIAIAIREALRDSLKTMNE